MGCNAIMDRYEARRRALQQLIDSMGRGAIATVAADIDKQPSYVSRMLYPPGKDGRKRIGEESWDLLTKAYPTLQDTSKKSANDAELSDLSDDQRAILDLYAGMSPEQRATWETVGRALKKPPVKARKKTK